MIAPQVVSIVTSSLVAKGKSDSHPIACEWNDFSLECEKYNLWGKVITEIIKIRHFDSYMTDPLLLSTDLKDYTPV